MPQLKPMQKENMIKLQKVGKSIFQKKFQFILDYLSALLGKYLNMCLWKSIFLMMG